MSGLTMFAGVFLLFVLVFNGGVGPDLYNYSIAASGACLIITGIMMLRDQSSHVVFMLALTAAITYSPIVHLHLTLTSSPDWVALVFDLLYVTLLLALLFIYGGRCTKRSAE